MRTLFCSQLVVYVYHLQDRTYFTTVKMVKTFPDTQIFNTRCPEMCKVYTEYRATSEIEHGSSACTVDNPLVKARGLSPYWRTNHALSVTRKWSILSVTEKKENLVTSFRYIKKMRESFVNKNKIILYYTILYCTVLCCAVLCCAVPCRAVPCRTVPYRTVPYHTRPHHTTPHHTTPHHTTPHHTTLHYTTLHYTTLHYTTLYPMLCYAMLCYAMLCHAMPCHVMSCHSIPYHTIPYHTKPYHTIPYHTIPYHTKSE